MTLYVSNRDGDGKTDEKGHYKFPSLAFRGSVVLPGLEVTQNSPTGMNVLVATGDFRIDTGNDYAYLGWNSASQQVTIATSDGANPRIDTVVIYIDKSVTTSPSPPNNPNVPKIVSVAGTPAALPSAPNDSTIQSAIGAGNPYIILADVRVNAGASAITNSNITDQRERVTIADGFITETSLADSTVTTNKVSDSAITTSKLANDSVTSAKILSGAAIKPTDILMFHAYKTTTQATVTTNAQTLITWNADIEYRGTSAFASNTFTAPVNGWLWASCCLTIAGGTATDDSMNWGFCVNGTTRIRQTDNWRYFSPSAGVEYPTSLMGGMQLNAGDQVTVQYVGTSYSVTIMGSASDDSYFSGLFIPSY